MKLPLTALAKNNLLSGVNNSTGFRFPYDSLTGPVVTRMIEHQLEHEELSVLQSKDSDHSVDSRGIVAIKLSRTSAISKSIRNVNYFKLIQNNFY